MSGCPAELTVFSVTFFAFKIEGCAQSGHDLFKSGAIPQIFRGIHISQESGGT